MLPCDDDPGATSNLNVDGRGQTRSTLALTRFAGDRALATTNGLTTVDFGPDGRACVYTLVPAHIVADLQGYFADDAFEDVPDRRLLDSRLR